MIHGELSKVNRMALPLVRNIALGSGPAQQNLKRKLNASNSFYATHQLSRTKFKNIFRNTKVFHSKEVKLTTSHLIKIFQMFKKQQSTIPKYQIIEISPKMTQYQHQKSTFKHFLYLYSTCSISWRKDRVSQADMEDITKTKLNMYR